MIFPDLVRDFDEAIKNMHGLPVVVDMGILVVFMVAIVLAYCYGIARLNHKYPKEKGH